MGEGRHWLQLTDITRDDNKSYSVRYIAGHF